MNNKKDDLPILTKMSRVLTEDGRGAKGSPGEDQPSDQLLLTQLHGGIQRMTWLETYC